ncbi:hypothetical protein [Desulfosarcina widdelii]|nr:hypothetical protein [Desulfosarcina widdelii]
MSSLYCMKTIINKSFSQRLFLSRLAHYPVLARLENLVDVT